VEEEERLEIPRADYFMNDEDDETEVSAAEAFFIKQGGNDKRVLMAMGIGVTNDDDSPFMDFTSTEFKSVKVSTLKPSNGYLVAEQRRRRLKNGDKPNGCNAQAKRKALWDYLSQNPVVNPTDVAFSQERDQDSCSESSCHGAKQEEEHELVCAKVVRISSLLSPPSCYYRRPGE